jgi:nucleosome binding factor SPN SPT16 subunit
MEPQVDQRCEAVLLPIYGVMVPFHITTIKNVVSTNQARLKAIDHRP